MNKTFVALICALAALAVPVVAAAKPGHPHHANAHRCTPHNVGYFARGTLTAPATLTQVAGADTPTNTGDDRYSGTLTVDVTHAPFHGKGTKGVHTFTVSHIRLGKGVTATPAAGTRVALFGRVTRVGKKCPSTAGTGVVTIRRAVLRAPAPAPATS